MNDAQRRSAWVARLEGGPFDGAERPIMADERQEVAPNGVQVLACPCCTQIVVAVPFGWAPLRRREFDDVEPALYVLYDVEDGTGVARYTAGP